MNTLCPGCFSDKGTSQQVCPACRFDEGLKDFLALPYRTLLDNKYLTGRVLGIGGFGITYLGWDVNLKTKVAIKEYLPRHVAGRHTNGTSIVPLVLRDDGTMRFGLEAFLKEAQSLIKFTHPNVVKIKNYFNQNDTAYFVMDYYEGMALDDYIKSRGGKLTEQEATKIMGYVLNALWEVHNKGFLHRDVKPENIFITSDRTPILIDFGAARFVMGQYSRSLSVVLTPGFAPYEQYHREGKQGAWTDIYSCGATLYTMVTGIDPPEATLRKDNADALIHPQRLIHALSDRFSGAIVKALAVEPADRFQTAREMLNALLKTVPAEEFDTAKCPYCSADNRVPKGKPLRHESCTRCGKPLVKPTIIEEPEKRITDPAPDNGKPKKHWRALGIAAVLLLIMATVFLFVRPWQEDGFLKIDTEPQGAAIYIDSHKEKDITPTVIELPTGAHTVLVKKEGYLDMEESVEVKGSKTPLKLILQKANASLTIDSKPSGAAVFIDGSNTDKTTPFTQEPVEPGTYEIKAEKDLYTGIKTVKVKPGQDKTVMVEMELAKEWTEKTTNMKFVLIKGDCYKIGDWFDEGFDDEKNEKERLVCVKDFYMGKYEVTQGQWKKIMNNNPSRFKEGDNYPVEKVSWNDAQEFIKKLNKKPDVIFSLPTEAEWEFACRERVREVRFGTGTDRINSGIANFDASESSEHYSDTGEYREATVPVDSFKANALGLYNMSGNVWEWCLDQYDEEAYIKLDNKENNPVFVQNSIDNLYDNGYNNVRTKLNIIEKQSGTGSRVRRGGSWFNEPGLVRCAVRNDYPNDYRNDSVGFRLVRRVSPQS